MVTNVTQGNTAQFTVEFLDANGNLITPASGQLVINYNAVGTLAPTSQTIALTLGGQFFTASWNSALAATGLAPWSVFAAGSTSVPAQSDTIRVIDP